MPAWAGNLGINSQIPAGAIAGLWFDYGASITNPQVLDGNLVPLTAGPLGVGNNTLDIGDGDAGRGRGQLRLSAADRTCRPTRSL